MYRQGILPEVLFYQLLYLILPGKSSIFRHLRTDVAGERTHAEGFNIEPFDGPRKLIAGQVEAGSQELEDI